MWKNLENVSEREYITMCERLENLETDRISENLENYFNRRMETLMEDIGAESGDISPDQDFLKTEYIRKLARLMVDIAYQNIGESLG